ncbi:L,D-transpeptidase family protein [Hutsoniella sourekii]|uniref:L,D-transpeptidase family protein n=1 Tax=Hutsoniella sourekii TaxID=87650 RepID=UPI0004B4A5E1|nr:L,D-transpeptidase family protein [Hutsoniella sourekii]
MRESLASINWKQPKLWAIASLGLLVLIYLMGIIYFNSHFQPGSKLGLVSISQDTVSQAQEHLNQKLPEVKLDLVEDGQALGQVSLKDLAIQFDGQEALAKKLDQQTAFLWPVQGFFTNGAKDLAPAFSLGLDQVEQLIQQLGINNEERPASESAQLIKQEDGSYIIQPETYGKQVSADRLQAAIQVALSQNQSQVDLKDAYALPEYTSDNQAMKERASQLQTMLQSQLTFQLEDQQVEVPTDVIDSWIYIDPASGEPSVDADAVRQYLGDLNAQYASIFQVRPFQSTYQGEVAVQPGTFGWSIDLDSEVPEVVQLIASGQQTVREPIISGSGYGWGLGVGPDYVEVDLTYQMMSIYKGGQLVLQTPIVSGNAGNGTVTIPGAYQVWNKESPSNLRGYNPVTNVDYVQPVQYWIAFDDQAQGIHDASWQGNFGGGAYLTAGSLGCINTPPDVMGQVFELVDYGMPVMIF